MCSSQDSLYKSIALEPIAGNPGFFLDHLGKSEWGTAPWVLLEKDFGVIALRKVIGGLEGIKVRARADGSGGGLLPESQPLAHHVPGSGFSGHVARNHSL